MKEKIFKKGIMKKLFVVILALAIIFTIIPLNVLEVKATDPELEPTLVETIYSTGIDDAGRWIFGKDFKVTSYHKILCEDGAYHWHIVSNYSTLNVESVKGKVFSKLVLHLVSPYSDTRLPNLPSYAVVTFSADKKTITISNLRETYIEIETYTSFNHAEVKSVDIYSGPCALSHVGGQNPTCEKDGWKDYYQCIDTTCRKIYATDVPSGTSYNSLDEWKVSPEGKIDAIGHDFSYSLETTNKDNDTIKATCSNVDKCDLTTADKSISLVLSTKDKYYDGYTYTGDAIDGTGKWYEIGLQIPRAKYVGRGGTTYLESEMRPREVGTYTAKISAGDPEVTATADFEIKDLPADAAPLCYCLNPAHVNHYYTFTDGLGFYVYNGTIYNKTETKAISQMTSPTYAYVRGTIESDKWYYKSEGVYVPGGECVQSKAPLHTHKWNYKSDGETMYAYCTEAVGNEYCVYQGTSADLTKAASFTIAADDRGFTGIDNIDNFNKATRLGLSENDVKFYKVETEGETTGGEDVTGTSLKNGFYYAALSVEDQTAVKAFSLAKDAPKPLTFKASEASTIKFKTAQFKDVKYNKNGNGWTAYTSEEVINLNEGDYVQFKATCTAIPVYSSGWAKFTITGEIEASGDTTSLIDRIGGDVALFGDDAAQTGVFYQLFKDCVSLTKAPNLPSTELGATCYKEMFSGCTSLTEAPELPATTVSKYCYQQMFSGCTNLTTAPELPATTIATRCYVSMFSGCTNLTTVPESLPATIVYDSCYASMFNGCTKITTAPKLPAEIAATACYQSMFEGCTNLLTAPELPATTVNEKCYWSMFNGCESLAEAPELPAESLTERCYRDMFSGCVRLKKVPELPATSLATECYASMFAGCTGLKIVPDLPAYTLASYCYSRMFSGCTSIELKESKVIGSHETEWRISATSENENWYQNMFADCPKVEIGEALELNKTYFQRGASHSHSFSYSVSADAENVLVATCTNEDEACMLDDGSETHAHSVSLTISAEDKNFSGGPATITIGSQAEIEAWENAGIIVPTTIYYEKADGTNLRTHAPVDASSYVAKVCPEGNMPREIDTAKASFTISKIESTATAPTAKADLVYTGTAQELVSAGSTDCGTLMYSLSPDGTFTGDIPTGTDAGSYDVYYKIIGDVNHLDKVFDAPIAVTISKVAYTGTNTATGYVLAGYASSDINVTLPAIPDHMTYGTPSFSAPFTSATIEGGKVKYSANNTAIVGTTYTITVPVSEKSEESANYNNYDIIVTLTGIDCSHSSTTPVSEVAATCIADGVKAHDLCSVCGLKLIDGIVKSDVDLKIEMLGHNWEYTANGATLTAACSRKVTCGRADVTLVLTADNADYSGSDSYAGATLSNLDDFKTATGLEDSDLVITYYKVDTEDATTGGTSVTAATLRNAAGYYYAAVTVGGKTAVESFKINKMDLGADKFNCTMPGPSPLPYDGNPKAATVVALDPVANNGAITIKYYDSSDNEVAAPTNVGTYTVKITVAEGSNYNATTALVMGTFTIDKAASYDGTKTASGTLPARTGKHIVVNLPELPAGASYGDVTNTANDGFFTVSEVAAGKVTVTSAKDWNETTETASRDFTVAVSGATNYPDYDVTVTITPLFHTHEFTYSSESNKLIATCGNEHCDLTENMITLSIIVDSAEISDDAVSASFDDDEKTAWENVTENSAPAIEYFIKGTDTKTNAENSGAVSEGAAPKKAGSYTVKITVDGKTASKDFDITKHNGPAAPTDLAGVKPSYIGDADGKITGVTTDMEYSVDGGETWKPITGTEITGLPAGDVKVRVKETDTVKAGEVATVTVPAGTEKKPSPAAPTGLAGVKPTVIDGTDGKVTGVTTAMEYSVDGGETWKPITGTEITGLPAGDVQVRIAETDTTKVGEVVTITIPAGTDKKPSPAAPTTPKAEKPSAKDAKDGKITGVTDKMEYSIDGGKTWIPVPSDATEIKDLPAGEVQIRIAETEDTSAGEIVKVTIPEGDEATPENPDDEDEDSADEDPADKAPTKEEQEIGKLDLDGKFKVTTGTSIKVEWGKVANAAGYDVYMTYCGQKYGKKPVATTNKQTVTIKKLNGKKIDTKKHVKVYVVAFKNVAGKKTTIAKTITAHAVGSKNTKATDAKKIKVAKDKITLKKGKTYTIKATTVKKDSKKPILTHVAEFRYASANKNIATVDKKGKIKAVKKGTCYVYVYAVNGCAKKVKVTVK